MDFSFIPHLESRKVKILMQFLSTQIKESEALVNQMESTHSKLNEAYDNIKSKSDKSTEDYHKAKAEVNEYKSMLSFKETQVGLNYDFFLVALIFKIFVYHLDPF